MPRGRPKGSKNLSVYEWMNGKKIREILAKDGITEFDSLRDARVLHDICVNTNGEVFVKYKTSKNPVATTLDRKNIR